MVRWVVWAGVLVLQQFSHGLSSRAKNSSSMLYNVIASSLSNGVWMISNLFLVDNVLKTISNPSPYAAVGLVTFYTAFTVGGSVLSQWLAMRYIEPFMEVKKGKK